MKALHQENSALNCDLATEDALNACDSLESLEVIELLLDIHPVPDPQMSQRAIRKGSVESACKELCRLEGIIHGGPPVPGGESRNLSTT